MEMINLQIQIFILLGIGYFLGKKEMITRPTLTQLTGLVMNLILPAAIIRSFQMDISVELLKETGLVLILSLLIQLFCMLLNKFIWNGVKERAVKTNLEYGTVVNNAGTMGMVIAEAAFGEKGLLFASIFMIPVRIMMWSYGLGLYAGKGDSKAEVAKKVLLHPCIVAIYIGIILMLLQSVGITLPKFAQSTLNAVANCNTAVCMLCIGVILSWVPVKEMLDKYSFIYSAIRLIAIPALIFIILLVLKMPFLVVAVCVLEAAMPAPSTMAMLAQKYDTDSGFASRMILISTVFSLITLPIWTFIVTSLL